MNKSTIEDILKLAEQKNKEIKQENRRKLIDLTLAKLSSNSTK